MLSIVTCSGIFNQKVSIEIWKYNVIVLLIITSEFLLRVFQGIGFEHIGIHIRVESEKSIHCRLDTS